MKMITTYILITFTLYLIGLMCDLFVSLLGDYMDHNPATWPYNIIVFPISRINRAVNRLLEERKQSTQPEFNFIKDNPPPLFWMRDGVGNYVIQNRHEYWYQVDREARMASELNSKTYING